MDLFTETYLPIQIDGQMTNYDVSNFGNVKNRNSGKILKPRIDRDGYCRIGIYHNGKYINRFIHRLVLYTFCPDKLYDTNLQVNHIDSNRQNNHLYNLEAVSAAENVAHSITYGYRNPRGENCALTKYDETIIHRICTLLEKGYQCKEISNILGIPRTNISDIKRGRTWCHIAMNYNIPSYVKRIDENIVRTICKYISDGDKSNIEIAALCGVNHKYVSLIRTGKRHKAILDEYMR